MKPVSMGLNITWGQSTNSRSVLMGSKDMVEEATEVVKGDELITFTRHWVESLRTATGPEQTLLSSNYIIVNAARPLPHPFKNP